MISSSSDFDDRTLRPRSTRLQVIHAMSVVGVIGARASDFRLSRSQSLSLSFAHSHAVSLCCRPPATPPPPPKPACWPPNVAVSSSGVGVVTPRRFRGKTYRKHTRTTRPVRGGRRKTENSKRVYGNRHRQGRADLGIPSPFEPVRGLIFLINFFLRQFD